MNKAPAACGNRPPLKDTSKHFVNTPTSKTLAAPSISVKRPHKNQDTHYFQQNDQPVVHVQKLSTSDRTPFLMGTSTPKKDGFLPSLTSRNLNNSNTTLISTAKLATSVAAATNTAATTTDNNVESNTANNFNCNSGTTNGGAGAVSNSNSNNTVYKKMTGNELSRWQQTWREILPKSYVYFEQDESNERDKKKAMIALKKLGATVEPFFCENVTIIISKRPYNKSIQYPKGDIFRYAVKKQLKVWNVEKVFRFLNHLGEQIPDVDELEFCATTAVATNNNHISQLAVSNNNANNNNLSNLLMNERIFGPSDRDPSVKRNDFKYFTELYLYIWDVTHKTRPVAIREWKDKSLYPKIHHTTNGKSLFVPESRSQNAISILKRHQRRLQCLSDTFSYRQSIIESSYNVKIPNHKIRHPSYEERVAFKRKWEESAYKSNPDENPKQKYQKLYDTLSDKDKKQFEDIFSVNDVSVVSLVDLSSSNKRQKDSTGEKLRDTELRDTDFQNNSKSLKDESRSLCVADNRIENSVNEVDLASNSPRDKSKIKVANQANLKIKSADYDIIEVVNDGDDNEEEEEDDDEDVGVKYEDILKLVSDKVDIIDGINNPLVNDTLLVDRAENGSKTFRNDLSEVAYQTAKQFRSLKRMPKLMREDSMMNGRSQNVSADGKLLCEYGEIAASGIQASGVNPSGTCSHGNAAGAIGNGLGPSKSQVVNKTLANEHKRIVVLTPTLNNRQKNNTVLATINPESLKNKENIVQKENCVTVLIADDTIPETQEQIMAGLKDSSNKTTINEDELAALRSVEAANPFISEGFLKQSKTETRKDATSLSATRNYSKTGNAVLKQNNENSALYKKQTKSNITAAIGVFKEEKFEKSKHEMKPGYCENCRVKYSDFSSHVLSDKHRSFAEDDSNFKQIDSLIDLLFIP